MDYLLWFQFLRLHHLWTPWLHLTRWKGPVAGRFDAAWAALAASGRQRQYCQFADVACQLPWRLSSCTGWSGMC